MPDEIARVDDITLTTVIAKTGFSSSITSLS